MHLWRKLGLHVLHLTPQHEGLQDLVQAVDDNNPFLSLQPLIFLLGPLCTFAQGIPEPFCEGAFVIKDLRQCMLSGLPKTSQRNDMNSLVYPEQCSQVNWKTKITGSRRLFNEVLLVSHARSQTVFRHSF